MFLAAVSIELGGRDENPARQLRKNGGRLPFPAGPGLCRRRVEEGWINFIVCYPGTPVYERAVREGRIREEQAYLSGLGPLGDKPYVNLTRWSDEKLTARRDHLLAGIPKMRSAR